MLTLVTLAHTPDTCRVTMTAAVSVARGSGPAEVTLTREIRTTTRASLPARRVTCPRALVAVTLISWPTVTLIRARGVNASGLMMTCVNFKPALVNVWTRKVLPSVCCSVFHALLRCSAPVLAPAAAQLCLTLTAGPMLAAWLAHRLQEASALFGRG